MDEEAAAIYQGWQDGSFPLAGRFGKTQRVSCQLMHAPAPPKKRAAVLEPPKAAELLAAYRLLTFLQAPFGFMFWLIEQRKARLQDQLHNEGYGDE
jgi:hypothetical protein